MARVIFWRHGQTDDNLAMRIQGQRDVPLNATGIAQAEAVAVEVMKMKPTHVISSPLSRAYETAAAVAGPLGLEIATDMRLQERGYGDWESLTGAEIKANWPEEHARWREGLDPAGVGIETRADCGARVKAAVLDALGAALGDAETADADPWGGAGSGSGSSAKAGEDVTLLVVSHGSAILTGITAMLGMNPSEWTVLAGMDNCHWALLTPGKGSTPPFRLRSYNRTHVAGPGFEPLRP